MIKKFILTILILNFLVITGVTIMKATEKHMNNETVFYVLYNPHIKKIDMPPGVKPSFYFKWVGDFYFLGKLIFKDKLLVSAEFLEFNEIPEVKKEIEFINKVLINYNKSIEKEDLEQCDELYFRNFFQSLGLDRFRDNELGEKYFKEKRTIIPLEEIKNKITAWFIFM